MPDLKSRYLSELAREGYAYDAAQAHALERLEALRQALLSDPPRRGWRRWLGRRTGPGDPTLPAGYYLYGGVGRGKTFVIDLCFEALPETIGKWRIHFHSFMQSVHEALRAVGDVANPLDAVADDLARRYRVLALDEFHVTDITDAMILGNLLQALAARRLTVLTTSNEHPENLYSGGLQRERFLPAIELLCSEYELVSFDGDTDYRLRQLNRAPVYFVPAGAAADRELTRQFDALARHQGAAGGEVVIDGRPIPARRRAEHLVWFGFADLCDGPRSARDYIELARRFETVMLSDVPIFDAAGDDAARRFMTLVDEFYDRNVKLIVSAAAEPEALYRGRRLENGFARTASRLTEMRSEAYLHRAHLS